MKKHTKEKIKVAALTLLLLIIWVIFMLGILGHQMYTGIKPTKPEQPVTRNG